MQVGVADPGSFASFGGFGFGGSSPVGPPASPGWDASDLLDVQVDHVAREAGQDRFADPVGLSGGVDVAPSVQAGSVQPSGHGTRRHHCPAHSQLVADAAGGPLVGAAPVLDEVHRLSAGAGGAVERGAGTVLKLRDSSLAITSNLLRRPWHGRCRPRRLRGRWGDRPGHASRAGRGPEVSKERYGGSWQRGFLLSEG